MDIREIIWQNVSRIMQANYGKENLSQLAHDCGWSPNQSTLLKKRETYITLKTLLTICERFNVEPWMLLHPEFDPIDPPKYIMSESDAQAFAAIKEIIARPK